MFEKLKIGTKLALIFIFVMIGPILTVSYLVFHTARQSLVTTRIAALESIAELKVDKIETYFEGLRKDIKIVQDYYNVKTNLPVVAQFATDRTHPTYLSAKKMLDDQLKAWPRVKSEIDDLMLVSPEGIVVYVTTETHAEEDLDRPLPDPDGKAFEEGKKGVYVTDIFENPIEEHEFGILVTAPAYDFDDTFIGAIAFEVDMGPMYEFIQDATGLGETGETLIGKKVGEAALFLNPLRHDKNAALKRKTSIGGKKAVPMQEAVQGRSGSGLSIDYRGEEIIAAWRYIPSRGWGLVAKIDAKEAFAPVRQLIANTILFTAVILVLAILLALFFSRAITGPVKKLSDVAHRISQGELQLRAEIASKDEIGLLAATFNRMTDHLVTSQEELIRNLSELKQAHEERMRLASFPELNPNPIAEVDLTGHIHYLNSKAMRLFPDLQEAGFRHPFLADLESKAATFQHEGKGSLVREVKVGDIWYEQVLHYVAQDRHIRIYALDITARKQDEEALRESREQSRLTVETAYDAFIGIGAKGLVLDWNRQAEATFGWSFAEVAGKPLMDFIIPLRDRKAHQEGLQRFIATGEGPVLNKRLELVALHRDGHEFPVELTIWPVQTVKGYRFNAFVHDITKRKFAEEKLKQAHENLKKSHEALQTTQLQLIQAEKMESVGRLAAGVAHEVKNPLGIIQMAVSYLSRHVGAADDKVKAVLKDVDDAVRRADGIIGGLLNFSASKKLELDTRDLNATIEHSLTMARHNLSKFRIKVVKELEEDLPVLMLDWQKIEQVFLDLFINAIDAMPHGGTLTVKTYVKKLTGVGNHVGQRKTDRFKVGERVVMAEVEDTGTGIPEEELIKIFDPFFTTKPPGKGTGLGLAVVQKIIDLHGAAIDIQNRKKTGVRVTLMFKTERKG